MALGLKCKSVAAYSLVSFMASSFSSLCVNANISDDNYGISTKKSGGYKEQQVSKTNSGVVSSKSSYLRFLVKFFGVLILILASIYALLLFFKCKNEGNPENSKLNPVQKNEKENKQPFCKNNELKNRLIRGKHIIKVDKKFEEADEPKPQQNEKKGRSKIVKRNQIKINGLNSILEDENDSGEDNFKKIESKQKLIQCPFEQKPKQYPFKKRGEEDDVGGNKQKSQKSEGPKEVIVEKIKTEFGDGFYLKGVGVRSEKECIRKKCGENFFQEFLFDKLETFLDSGDED